MQSELAHETLDRQNQAMTENLAMKVSRLRDVSCSPLCYVLCECFLCKCVLFGARYVTDSIVGIQQNTNDVL